MSQKVAKRERWDMSRPETKRMIDEIVHGSFVKEGTMVAFPTCFPGASTPIPADESHITALESTQEGVIYGGTSGRTVHIFVAMFHGVTGVVFDLGWLDGYEECRRVFCTESDVIAFVRGSRGWAFARCPLQPLPFDLIQEWGFTRPQIALSPLRLPAEPIDASIQGDTALVSTGNSLFDVDPKTGKIASRYDLRCVGKMARDPGGGTIGVGGDYLWRFRDGELDAQWTRLPNGSWSSGAVQWSTIPGTQEMYLADDEGGIFVLRADEPSARLVARTPLTPVGPMAATFDGRLFGFCGEGISRLFCYDLGDGELRDLGVAVSVLERRRYGYQFGAATCGRDGELVFGEDDDLGHLWLYFPRIKKIHVGSPEDC